MLFSSNTFYFFKYSLYGYWDLWDYFKIHFLPLCLWSVLGQQRREKQRRKGLWRASPDQSSKFVSKGALVGCEAQQHSETLVTQTILHSITARAVCFKWAFVKLQNNGIALRKLRMIGRTFQGKAACVTTLWKCSCWQKAFYIESTVATKPQWLHLKFCWLNFWEVICFVFLL